MCIPEVTTIAAGWLLYIPLLTFLSSLVLVSIIPGELQVALHTIVSLSGEVGDGDRSWMFNYSTFGKP